MNRQQGPYDNVRDARKHHRRTRLNILRAMCTASRLNGSAFAMLYISPAGETETFSSTALRSQLGVWFNPKVRKQAKDAVTRYYRNRSAIAGPFAMPHDFRGEFEESALAMKEEAREAKTGRRAGRSRRASNQREDVDDEWMDYEAQNLGQPEDSEDEGSTIIKDVDPSSQWSDAGRISLDRIASATQLPTPSRAHPRSQNGTFSPSSSAVGLSNGGALGRSPSLAKVHAAPSASAHVASSGAGGPTPPLSTSPNENETSYDARALSSPVPACRLVSMSLSPATLDEWYLSRFELIPYEQQSELCQFWVRAFEPDHQANYPYNKGEAVKPHWWPAEVPHKPPSRLSERDRPILLTALIRSRDRPLSAFEDMTTQESYDVSLELDYLLVDVYKVARIEREIQSQHVDAPNQAFTVAVLPIDSELLCWHTTSHRTMDVDRRPTTPSASFLASPIKPLESPLGPGAASASASKTSGHRSRQSLSALPSAATIGVSPAPRARMMAQPYSLSRSNSVSDVYGPSLAASSRPLSRSQSLTGGSLEEAMASKERGVGFSRHRRQRASLQLDTATVALATASDAKEAGATSTSATALQRALEGSNDTRLQSPSATPNAPKRPHQSPGAASFGREPAFASPAMIKSNSRLSFLGALIESIPEGADGTAPSPSRNASTTSSKRSTRSKSLSRQGSRTSASKKERSRVAAPKAIQVHPAHQFDGYLADLRGVPETDYPTPTYPSHGQAPSYEVYEMAPESQGALHRPKPASAEDAYHVEQQRRAMQQQQRTHHQQLQAQARLIEPASELYEDQPTSQLAPAHGTRPRPPPSTFVVPANDDQVPREYAQHGYPSEQYQHQQQRQQMQYLPTPETQHFDHPYPTQGFAQGRSHEQPHASEHGLHLVPAYRGDTSPYLGGTGTMDHSPHVGYPSSLDASDAYAAEAAQAYASQAMGYYRDDGAGQHGAMPYEVTPLAGGHQEWAPQHVAGLGLGLEGQVTGAWGSAAGMYDDRGAPMVHHDAMRYEQVVAYGAQ